MLILGAMAGGMIGLTLLSASQTKTEKVVLAIGVYLIIIIYLAQTC